MNLVVLEEWVELVHSGTLGELRISCFCGFSEADMVLYAMEGGWQWPVGHWEGVHCGFLECR